MCLYYRFLTVTCVRALNILINIEQFVLRSVHVYVIFYKIPTKGIPKTEVMSKPLVSMSEVKQFVSET